MKIAMVLRRRFSFFSAYPLSPHSPSFKAVKRLKTPFLSLQSNPQHSPKSVSGMGFGALRYVIRPLSRIVLPTSFFSSAAKTSATTTPPELRQIFGPFRRDVQWVPPHRAFHSLTETRYPKRRPSDKPRRKRAFMKTPGPYAWVKCAPGEPIVPNQPNEGSVKRRNEKKRIKLHCAFIKSERKKRKVQIQEAKEKKLMKRVERKMAAVARERAWAERLVELKLIEEKKKAAMP